MASRSGSVFLLGALGLALMAGCSSKSGDEDSTAGSAGLAGEGGGAATPGTLGTGASSGAGAASGTGGVTGSTTEALPACEVNVNMKSCAASQMPASKRNVNLLLVMDKSESMNKTPTGYKNPLWTELKTALGTVLTDVKDELRVGLLLYPNAKVPAGCTSTVECCAVSGVDVAVAPGAESVPAIVDALAATSPGGGTPIAKALDKALAYFSGSMTLSGDKYVVLATDGGPNCNDSLNCQGAENKKMCTLNVDKNRLEPGDDNLCLTNSAACVDNVAVAAKIDELAQVGVQTIVVGIPGSEMYSEYLDTFAEAGGRPRQGAAHRYYEVSASSGSDALTNTFRSITVDLVKSCVIDLPATGDKSEVNVTVDCELIKSGGDNGWKFSDDNKQIILLGSTCERVSSKGAKRIDVVLGCPTLT